MVTPVRLAARLIGPGQPCFVIAEAGVNHDGDMTLAHRLIDAAKAAGADAVKFQSFVTEQLVTAQADKADYQVQTTGTAGGQYEMLKRLELSPAQQADLKAHCDQARILYLCTPYDHQSVEMLDRMGVAAFKISSTDVTNIPLLRDVARRGRPVILSTGMSTMAEVRDAVEALRAGGLGGQVILLHCTSAYPAPIEELNLRAISAMQQAFGCSVGFSDHTAGVGATPWAVVLGACVVEKHFTVDRRMAGPDHRASLEPHELAELVRAVRNVEAALGDGLKRPMPSELRNKPHLQKSLVATRRIPAGERISAGDLACKRPGIGLPPSWFDRVVGQTVAIEIPQDGVLTEASLKWRPARGGSASPDVHPVDASWEPALRAFFEVVRRSGDEQFFHPHPLTDQMAARLAQHRGRDLYYVLADEQAVLGYGLLRGWDEGYDTPSLGIIIHPAARGQGLGRRLMQALHEAARQRGASRVRLKVHPDNAPALALYRKLGYVFSGECDAGQLVGYLELAPVPVSAPDLSGRETAYLLECLASTRISSKGGFIDRFEQAFRDYLGAPHALTTCNGTAALHLILAALGIGPGDEVIVPTLTYVASASVVRYVGATPVFVDVDAETWNLTAEAVRAAITPRTRAVVAVHLYGNPVDLAPLQALCWERGLRLIEDAAEALGAEYHGRKVGTLGDAAAFSFYGNKTISTGEGGMIVTSDDELACAIHQLKNHGESPGRRYWYARVGFNYRMTNLQAAVGLAQMERVEQFVARKRQIAACYRAQLSVPGLMHPVERPGTVHSHWMSCVALEVGGSEARDTLMAGLAAQGIETRRFFYPLHTLPIFQDLPPARCPTAESIAARGLNLPSSTTLRDADIERVSRAVRDGVPTAERAHV